MPRPALMGQDHLWSFRQAWVAAGVTDKSARAAISKELVDGSRIADEDLLVLRVASSLSRFPSPPLTVDKDILKTRDADAAEAARRAWRTETETHLLVRPLDVTLVTDPETLPKFVHAYRNTPLLLLPLSVWATELRNNIRKIRG